jgi:hypothetical protein
MDDDAGVVAIHPDDVDHLIQLLQGAREELRRINEIGEAASAAADEDQAPPPLRSV